jgi:hypothetical protein
MINCAGSPALLEALLPERKADANLRRPSLSKRAMPPAAAIMDQSVCVMKANSRDGSGYQDRKKLLTSDSRISKPRMELTLDGTPALSLAPVMIAVAVMPKSRGPDAYS